MRAEPRAILVVEDEPYARNMLQVTLAREGYSCLHASTGVDGIAATADLQPSVVLLDLGLPDLGGVEVTREIRQRSAVPIIVVSGCDKETEKVAALDAGANDYVTKPFGAEELLARIRVALRSAAPAADVSEIDQVAIGDLTIDFTLRHVRISGKPVYLTPTEYRLLEVLVRAAGRLVTHQQILHRVWGPSYTGQLRSLRVYMHKLRFKLEAEPARPKYLVSEPGVGYRLRMLE